MRAVIGSASWLAKDALVRCLNDWNAASSIRGAVKLKYTNCNKVSKSFGEQLPFKPSLKPLIVAPIVAFLPANTFSKSTLLKLPKPPRPATEFSIFSWRASLVPNTDVPPGLNARMRISSALKSVVFTTTRTPFERVRAVEPKGPSSVFTIVPAFGVSFINGSSETLST